MTVTDTAISAISENVARALAEDVGGTDVSAALIPEHLNATAEVVSREPAILCGVPWFDETFRQLDTRIHVRWFKRDGDGVGPGDRICRLSGPARPLLTGERTALNFLQTLSATATVTAHYVQCLGGAPTLLMDTRKTLPGLRYAQKYAVRCGGGHNQRHGLYDAILIKENHIAASGSLHAAVKTARQSFPELPLQVEVENLDQLKTALEAGVRQILLDNFSLADIRAAVALAKGFPDTVLEASGNIDENTIGEVAACGVDRISTGAITKNIRAIDFSMRFDGAMEDGRRQAPAAAG
jgi:nicotinate-nucleotide pyrophosphorylase (carboxylating)